MTSDAASNNIPKSMKVLLAGYNIDADVIEELKKHSPPRQDITPETISAAYARISRDPRSVDELRKLARDEVEKARKSNRNIIFNMGHHSVAEHAVFNFDIIGVSRYAIESLEKFRLCSYTEKSQRYQKLEDDYIVPPEIKGSEFEADFIDTVKMQNGFYHRSFETLKGYVFKKNAKLAENPKNKNLLEGWAKEDARYATSLATLGQLGMTINARNLELLFRRFASQKLEEVKNLGKEMYQLVEPIAPSIILFKEANNFDLNTYDELKDKALDIIGKGAKVKGISEIETLGKAEEIDEVKLIDCPKQADDRLVCSLLHTVTGLNMGNCENQVKKMTAQEKTAIIKTAMQNMEFYDSTLREFEHINLTFELIVSSACFGQLKRHRMASITCQDYDPRFGITIPDSIVETGLEEDFREIVKLSEKLYFKILKKMPHMAPYILTNAHCKRVLLTCNLREFYHISRLREDKHAQWDIRYLSAKMAKLAKEVMPFCMLLIGGKDSFVETYKEKYGKMPNVIPPEEA